MGDLIMKKTIITAMVAVSALGFSGTSFAVGAAAAAPDLFSNNDIELDVSLINETNDFNVDVDKSVDIDVDKRVRFDSSINADDDAPAAGGNLQVAYDAPAVGGDMIDVSSVAFALQLGDAESTYADLDFMGSGGVIAGSGPAAAAADASPLGGAAAAGGDSGNVNITATSGAITTGAVDINLSNTATALGVGGSYNYNAAVTP
ncbi:hypothetical protein BIU88_06960 [Chlorobaculum limnaeum]|uniref:Uncharacterized protein n=2 Tax=Chlorobaculum limnaeum TaxID=274537 RepID=A0A1D8D0H8_CHLLM|nr:hypothetical protein BIU88_06960 [Chlorobaculum limnaeum]